MHDGHVRIEAPAVNTVISGEGSDRCPGFVRNIATSGRFPAPTPPALDMGLRIDKATGAHLAVLLVKSACMVVSKLATLNKVFGFAP
jgi:hypothetical protein